MVRLFFMLHFTMVSDGEVRQVLVMTWAETHAEIRPAINAGIECLHAQLSNTRLSIYALALYLWLPGARMLTFNLDLRTP